MCILHQVPSQANIERELRKILFKKKVFCPWCGSYCIKKYEGRYRCKRCRKPFSLKSVCWLKGAKLSLRMIWLLLWCWCNKVPIDQTRKVCGLSEITVRRWFEKFRNHLPEEKLFKVRLSGIVQMDEFYRGGKKRGYSIIGAKQQKKSFKRKIVLQYLNKPSVDRKDVIDFLSQWIEPFTQLQTDGSSVYKGISNWWPVKHLYEIHKKWEFTLTSEIEGLWGNFITFVRRMYHHITKDKLPSYLREFTARQVYPEWFKNPQSFLKISLPSLSEIVKEKEKSKKENSSTQKLVFSTPVLKNPLISVPKID